MQFLARHRHWTPFAHTNLIYARTLADQDLIKWFANRTPGFEAVVLSAGNGETTVIESGSVFAWIENHRLIPSSHWNYIAKEIRTKFPTVYRVYELSHDDWHGESITSYGAIDSALERDIFSVCDPIGLTERDVAKLVRLTFRCHSPFPIRTHAFKHKYGFVENEISRRYVSSPPEFYRVDYWRKKAENVKQGSSIEAIDTAFGGKPLDHLVEAHYQSSARLYNGMIESGTCAEQARFVLPNATMTSWYWTGTLDAYCRFFRERIKEDAQKEVRMLANSIFDQVFARYPRIVDALM